MRPKAAVIFIAGFRQGLAEPTGTEIMFVRANREHGDKPGIVVIRPYRWRNDWVAEAAFLQRQFVVGEGFCDPERTRVLVVAYSWGAGHGFQELSRALLSRGVYIDIAILIDPVYHWRYSPLSVAAGVFAMSTMGRIHIASNVRTVHYFRQFRNRPMGRECVPMNPYFTTIHPPTELECRHQLADKNHEVHALVKREISLMVASVESQGTGK